MCVCVCVRVCVCEGVCVSVWGCLCECVGVSVWPPTHYSGIPLGIIGALIKKRIIRE